jgi:glycosyltransferase involved in cell wall biosynthesis
MPTLSIVTAVHADGYRFLSDTIDGVARQELPDGWELEWLVQEDGDEPRLEEVFAALPMVRYDANGRQFGPGVTRNVALSRATGELVRNLDHDDVLLPGALAGLVPRFDDPSIVWAVTQADDLLPDGTRRGYESALPFGVLEPGVVNDWAIEHAGVWPIHAAGLMVRTQTLRAVGGWSASPSDDDLGMFAAVSEVGAGYNDPAVGWLYRHHPEQLSRQRTWWSGHERSKLMIVQRVAAIRNGPPLDVTPMLTGGRKLPSGWWRD